MKRSTFFSLALAGTFVLSFCVPLKTAFAEDKQTNEQYCRLLAFPLIIEHREKSEWKQERVKGMVSSVKDEVKAVYESLGKMTPVQKMMLNEWFKGKLKTAVHEINASVENIWTELDKMQNDLEKQTFKTCSTNNPKIHLEWHQNNFSYNRDPVVECQAYKYRDVPQYFSKGELRRPHEYRPNFPKHPWEFMNAGATSSKLGRFGAYTVCSKYQREDAKDLCGNEGRSAHTVGCVQIDFAKFTSGQAKFDINDIQTQIEDSFLWSSTAPEKSCEPGVLKEYLRTRLPKDCAQFMGTLPYMLDHPDSRESDALYSKSSIEMPPRGPVRIIKVYPGPVRIGVDLDSITIE